MELTREWIKIHYILFNNEYFMSKCPPINGIKVTVGRGKITRGYCISDRNGKVLELNISAYYKHEETYYIEVLLHEMIHMMMAYNMIYERKHHGPLFREFVDMIRKRTGYNVSYDTVDGKWTEMEGNVNGYVLSFVYDEHEYITRVDKKYIARAVKKLNQYNTAGTTIKLYKLSCPQINSMTNQRFCPKTNIKAYTTDMQGIKNVVEAMKTTAPVHIFS